MTKTELMPRLVVGDTELGGGKLKKSNRFLEPNFELGPTPSVCASGAGEGDQPGIHSCDKCHSPPIIANKA